MNQKGVQLENVVKNGVSGVVETVRIHYPEVYLLKIALTIALLAVLIGVSRVDF